MAGKGDPGTDELETTQIPPADPGEITLLLNRAAAGARDQHDRLADLVYTELRRIASHVMVSESRAHTIQPTMIATEAYLKLVDRNSQNWQNRAHFFAAAAQSMRRIMVDYGRRRHSLKRGGFARKVEIDEAMQVTFGATEDVLALDEALTRLERIDSRQSQIVELRYFSGLTEEETAAVLGIGLRTVKREWSVARSWLHAELTRTSS